MNEQIDKSILDVIYSETQRGLDKPCKSILKCIDDMKFIDEENIMFMVPKIKTVMWKKRKKQSKMTTKGLANLIYKECS